MTEQDLKDNTYWDYNIRVTGNLYSGALVTANFNHSMALRAKADLTRDDWLAVIKSKIGGDFEKIIDFEVLEHEKVCVVNTLVPWDFEDSEINYDLINNPEEN
jgi:hypothetical protein